MKAITTTGSHSVSRPFVLAMSHTHIAMEPNPTKLKITNNMLILVGSWLSNVPIRPLDLSIRPKM